MTKSVPHLVEEDHVPALKLFLLAVLLVAIVVGACVALRQVFLVGARLEIERKAEQPTETGYAAQRAAEENDLQSYGALDQKTNTYRIPITRAMELVAQDPALASQVPLKP